MTTSETLLPGGDRMPASRRRAPASRHHGLAVALAAGLVLTAACTGSPDDGGPDTWSAGALRLVAFDSCDAAGERLRRAALDQVGPWGFGAAGASVDLDGAAEADDSAAGVAAPRLAAPDAAGAPPGESAGGRAPSHSDTNVHEAGVDEPDLVKTDGRRIITVAHGLLRVVDAQRRVETGTLALYDDTPEAHRWHTADLMLHGDRALVLMREGWGGAADLPMPMPRPEPAPDRGVGTLPAPGETGPAGEDARELLPEPITGPRLLLVDLVGAPRVISEYAVDGGLVDARATGGIARVVVRSAPRVDLPMLAPEASESERLAANQEAVGSAEVTDWLPRYQVTTAGSTSTGQVDCTSVSHPETYSGTSMLTVLTFDLAAGQLGDGNPVSVVADGDTVYGSGTSLYVASDQRWRMPVEPDEQDPARQRTEIYKFDLSGAGPPRYAAAGAVPGWLINQYALSEWDGHLRVATTSGERWTADGTEPDSESSVYVLAERGGELVEVGSVGGLGQGERIYAVRYAGPVGYVVTFRETDPLYTVDLSDPTAPAVLGELKITGYSAYLHPIDGDRVLGVGQEADRTGRVQGTQVSLFDISDLSDPRLQAQHHVRLGSSEAEHDPHAFLWWPQERILVVPLVVHGDGARELTQRDAPARAHYGALVLRVEDGELVELDLVSHPASNTWEDAEQIRRSLVIGDTLWTVSTLGLQANQLTTLDTLAWLPFN